MTPFHLVILTPRETVYDGEVLSVVLPTADGAAGFLYLRERTTVEVVPGDLTFRTEQREYTFETDGGIAEMTGERMTFLCGEAYDKNEADARKARRSAELDEERARQERSLAEYKLNRAALIRAFDKIRRSRTK